MISFKEALDSRKLLLFDGATGTQLAARGGVAGPAANLECPDIVRAVHMDYKKNGADIIITNTLTANRISLEHSGIADRFEDINRIGAHLAAEAADGGCYVAGNMGSTGKFLEPLGEYTEQQFYDNAAEQAAILAENGVHFILIETMTDVREAAIAARAAKEASGLPVVASISFDPVVDGFRTMMGDTVAKAVQDLTAAGADAVGTNCGTVDPFEMSRIVSEMRSLTDMPLCAESNAGKPELQAGESVFRLAPEDFADGMQKCIEAGALLVGGCCGTTPYHIAELARRVK